MGPYPAPSGSPPGPGRAWEPGRPRGGRLPRPGRAKFPPWAIGGRCRSTRSPEALCTCVRRFGRSSGERDPLLWMAGEERKGPLDRSPPFLLLSPTPYYCRRGAIATGVKSSSLSSLLLSLSFSPFSLSLSFFLSSSSLLSRQLHFARGLHLGKCCTLGPRDRFRTQNGFHLVQGSLPRVPGPPPGAVPPSPPGFRAPKETGCDSPLLPPSSLLLTLFSLSREVKRSKATTTVLLLKGIE